MHRLSEVVALLVADPREEVVAPELLDPFLFEKIVVRCRSAVVEYLDYHYRGVWGW